MHHLVVCLIPDDLLITILSTTESWSVISRALLLTGMSSIAYDKDLSNCTDLLAFVDEVYIWFLDFKRNLLVLSHFSIMFWHSNIATLLLKKLQFKRVLQGYCNIKSNHSYLHSMFSSSKPGGSISIFQDIEVTFKKESFIDLWILHWGTSVLRDSIAQYVLEENFP